LEWWNAGIVEKWVLAYWDVGLVVKYVLATIIIMDEIL
jgi:hypothetical protein